MIKKEEKIKRVIRSLLPVLVAVILLTHPAAAAGIASSKFGTGTKKLISDVSTYLTILCPIAGTAAAVYCAIRRGMAMDEAAGKMWEGRIKTAIICGVGGCLASGIIAAVSSYY